MQKYQIEIGGKTKEQLKADLMPPKYYITDWANRLLESKDFTIVTKTENVDLVRLAVKDLGFPNGATTEEIYQKAERYGLELCPPEVGPHLRLSYSGSDWMWIAMKPITDRAGLPGVFYLGHGGEGLSLGAHNAEPSDGWNSRNMFFFRLRKKLGR